MRHAPALPVGAQLSPTALAQCKNVAEHEGWVHIDEVEYKGCGKSAIEVRKLIRFWLVGGEGKLQWFQEGQDNKAGDLVDTIDISGSAVDACVNPVIADREALPFGVRLELPPSLMARLQAEQSPEEEAAQLDEVWEEIDEDGSGELDVDEFIELVRKLRGMLGLKPMPEKKIRKAFRKLDDDGGGTLDQDEFQVWWKKQRKAAAKAEKARTVYYVCVKPDKKGEDSERRRWLRALQEGSRYEKVRVECGVKSPEEEAAAAELKKAETLAAREAAIAANKREQEELAEPPAPIAEAASGEEDEEEEEEEEEREEEEAPQELT